MSRTDKADKVNKLRGAVWMWWNCCCFSGALAGVNTETWGWKCLVIYFNNQDKNPDGGSSLFSFLLLLFILQLQTNRLKESVGSTWTSPYDRMSENTRVHTCCVLAQSEHRMPAVMERGDIKITAQTLTVSLRRTFTVFHLNTGKVTQVVVWRMKEQSLRKKFNPACIFSTALTSPITALSGHARPNDKLQKLLCPASQILK